MSNINATRQAFRTYEHKSLSFAKLEAQPVITAEEFLTVLEDYAKTYAALSPRATVEIFRRVRFTRNQVRDIRALLRGAVRLHTELWRGTRVVSRTGKEYQEVLDAITP